MIGADHFAALCLVQQELNSLFSKATPFHGTFQRGLHTTPMEILLQVLHITH